MRCGNTNPPPQYSGFQADVWSVGILLYALLVGHLPFDGVSVHEVMVKVTKGKYDLPRNLPPQATDLLARLLQVDPKVRPTLTEVEEHPYLSSTKYVVPFPMTMLEFQTETGALQRDAAVAEGDVDADALRAVVSLGWGGAEGVLSKLTATEPSFERVYYRMFLAKVFGH